MKIEQLYEDYNVPYATPGHKNVRDGWLGVDCPFCVGKLGYHLGYNLDDDYFFCWRCGHHPVKKTLSKLLNIEENGVEIIIKRYTGGTPKIKTRSERTRKTFSLPTGSGPMLRNHEQYLLRRGFDPDQLASTWGLLGTGPVARLDELDYKHRIIAPIEWNGNIVSFQARDITDKQFAKYKTCPKERETIHHKDILYGKQRYWTSTGIIVEGITDVWRFGVRAACTFGIQFKSKQAKIIGKSFDRVFIIFDPEKQAQRQAKQLMHAISHYLARGKIHIYDLGKNDPGSLTQTEADYIIKQLIK
jgi:hypothetical protein